MNLNSVRLLAMRAVNVILHVLDGGLDGGLDGAIESLAKAEQRLARVADRLDARIDTEYQTQLASYDREEAVALAERAAREASRARAATLAESRNRAARIQSRISALLN